MAFKPSAAKKHANEGEASLNMNSMMDMMTIILLFLLKSFSTGGALVTPSKDLALPESTRSQKPKKEVTVAITKTGDIVLNDEHIADINSLKEPGNLIGPLASRLREIAQEAKDNEANYGIPFSHVILIQGDQMLPYEYFSKVLYTCGDSEFYNMRILTVKNLGRNQ
jgi:biopolymer transport protein ExbD